MLSILSIFMFQVLLWQMKLSPDSLFMCIKKLNIATLQTREVRSYCTSNTRYGPVQSQLTLPSRSWHKLTFLCWRAVERNQTKQTDWDALQWHARSGVIVTISELFSWLPVSRF